MSAQTEERSLPSGNEHLLQWTQRNYGAVTSFTEVKMTKRIDIKVGEGKSNIGLQYLSTNLTPVNNIH